MERESTSRAAARADIADCPKSLTGGGFGFVTAMIGAFWSLRT
jgi:hypothetical protein